MNVRKKYRRFVCLLLCLSLTALAFCIRALLCVEIPDQLKVEKEGEVPEVLKSLPEGWVVSRLHVPEEPGLAASAGQIAAETESREEQRNSGSSMALRIEADTVKEAETGGALPFQPVSGRKNVQGAAGYAVSYSLFGKIPLKTVSVSVAGRQKVYAGGTPIGIYLETAGVFVVDTGAIETQDGSCCPAENIVRSGDYIQAVNGETLHTKEDLISCLADCRGEAVVLDIVREGRELRLRILPVQDTAGEYRIGVWVRNDTQGIGTLTYVDENGSFGALGHGISDVDTGELLHIENGVLYSAEVVSVVKGVQGTPGELSGIIHYSEGYRIGTIEENRKNGIYGSVAAFPAMVQDRTLYETAMKQEIEEGPAVILSTVDGSCREYEVEIREIRLNGSDINKGMVILVTDEELLGLTGGIVQGMSGSPIIQNGKLVGAVTHVLVNDPTRGYGIFIENMLETAG